MKRGNLILCLFLVSLLFISGCAEFGPMPASKDSFNRMAPGVDSETESFGSSNSDVVYSDTYCDSSGENCFYIHLPEASEEYQWVFQTGIGISEPHDLYVSDSSCLGRYSYNGCALMVTDSRSLFRKPIKVQANITIEYDGTCEGDECGTLIIQSLQGEGNAYACIDSEGALFRSDIPCINY